RTISSALEMSAWSSQFTVRTDVAPSAVSNLTATTGTVNGSIALTWTAPGDDQNTGSLNPGTFRIFFSTVSSDVSSLTAQSSTSSTLSKLDISTSGVAAGSSQGYSINGLSGNATYYVRIFTADEVPNWSTISNGATTYATYTPGGTITWTGTTSTNWSTA